MYDGINNNIIGLMYIDGLKFTVHVKEKSQLDDLLETIKLNLYSRYVDGVPNSFSLDKRDPVTFLSINISSNTNNDKYYYAFNFKALSSYSKYGNSIIKDLTKKQKEAFDKRKSTYSTDAVSIRYKYCKEVIQYLKSNNLLNKSVIQEISFSQKFFGSHDNLKIIEFATKRTYNNKYFKTFLPNKINKLYTCEFNDYIATIPLFDTNQIVEKIDLTTSPNFFKNLIITDEISKSFQESLEDGEFEEELDEYIHYDSDDEKYGTLQSLDLRREEEQYEIYEDFNNPIDTNKSKPEKQKGSMNLKIYCKSYELQGISNLIESHNKEILEHFEIEKKSKDNLVFKIPKNEYENNKIIIDVNSNNSSKNDKLMFYPYITTSSTYITYQHHNPSTHNIYYNKTNDKSFFATTLDKTTVSIKIRNWKTSKSAIKTKYKDTQKHKYKLSDDIEDILNVCKSEFDKFRIIKDPDNIYDNNKNDNINNASDKKIKRQIDNNKDLIQYLTFNDNDLRELLKQLFCK
ncbi:MAG: hypothetical protein U9N59_01010 [Campylobacterota bacterium]|nr:hypothetical protein [Campylobacterota bacterium]